MAVWVVLLLLFIPLFPMGVWATEPSISMALWDPFPLALRGRTKRFGPLARVWIHNGSARPFKGSLEFAIPHFNRTFHSELWIGEQGNLRVDIPAEIFPHLHPTDAVIHDYQLKIIAPDDASPTLIVRRGRVRVLPENQMVATVTLPLNPSDNRPLGLPSLPWIFAAHWPASVVKTLLSQMDGALAVGPRPPLPLPPPFTDWSENQQTVWAAYEILRRGIGGTLTFNPGFSNFGRGDPMALEQKIFHWPARRMEGTAYAFLFGRVMESQAIPFRLHFFPQDILLEVTPDGESNPWWLSVGSAKRLSLIENLTWTEKSILTQKPKPIMILDSKEVDFLNIK